jgi:hypothetical protein
MHIARYSPVTPSQAQRGHDLSSLPLTLSINYVNSDLHEYFALAVSATLVRVLALLPRANAVKRNPILPQTTPREVAVDPGLVPVARTLRLYNDLTSRLISGPPIIHSRIHNSITFHSNRSLLN